MLDETFFLEHLVILRVFTKIVNDFLRDFFDFDLLGFSRFIVFNVTGVINRSGAAFLVLFWLLLRL